MCTPPDFADFETDFVNIESNFVDFESKCTVERFFLYLCKQIVHT